MEVFRLGGRLHENDSSFCPEQRCGLNALRWAGLYT
jgi:hypothetical protein